VIRQAQPLKTIQNKNVDLTLQAIQKLVKEWEVTHFVVGLPTHPDGAEHEMTNRAKRFGNQLHGRLNLPVQWVDEGYTSAVVDDQHGDIDGQAAVLILEQYFQETPD
jgi:putative Holliday junction resolvase